MNNLAGRFRGVTSTTAQAKLADPRVTFLDVRTPGECQQLSLAGGKNNIQCIPLEQLRGRPVESLQNEIGEGR